MPTNNAMINDALSEIQIAPEGVTANATQLADGLTELNRMMAEWTENDMDVGYFPQDTGTDSIPVPTWAERAVQANLAANLASFYRIPITIDLAQKASDSAAFVAKKCINSNLKGVDMDHLPIGSGSYSTHNIENDT